MTNRTDTFKLFYGATGEQRKELVKAISRIMNAAAHYEGAPSFNYTIDYVTVEPDGTVSFDARADSEEIERLIDGLAEAGFTVYGGVNAPYIWLKTPDQMTSWEFFDYLLENANVVGTPGSGFGPSGEGYFRLTAFGNYENTVKALERIKAL